MDNKNGLIRYVRFPWIIFFVLTSVIISLFRGQFISANAQYQYSHQVIGVVPRDANNRYTKTIPALITNSKLPITSPTSLGNPSYQSDKPIARSSSGQQNVDTDSRLSKLCQQTSDFLVSMLPAPFGGQKRSILCQFFDSIKSLQPATVIQEQILHQQSQPIYPIMPPLKLFGTNNNDPHQQYYQHPSEDTQISNQNPMDANDGIGRLLKPSNHLNHFNQFNSSNQYDDMKASSSYVDHSYMQRAAGKQKSTHIAQNHNSYLNNKQLHNSLNDQLAKNSPRTSSISSGGMHINSERLDATTYDKSTISTSLDPIVNGHLRNNKKKLESSSSPTGQIFSVTPSQIQTSGWKVMSNYRKESTPPIPPMASSLTSASSLVNVTSISFNKEPYSHDLSSNYSIIDNFSFPVGKSNHPLVSTSSLSSRQISQSSSSNNSMANKISSKTLAITIQSNETKSINNKSENKSLHNVQHVDSQSKMNALVAQPKPKIVNLPSSSPKNQSSDAGKIGSVPSGMAEVSIVPPVEYNSNKDWNKYDNKRKDDISEQRHEEIVIASINNLTRLAFGNQIRDTVRAISKLIDQQQQQLNVNQHGFNASLVNRANPFAYNLTKPESGVAVASTNIKTIMNNNDNDLSSKSLNKSDISDKKNTKFSSSAKISQAWNKQLAKMPSNSAIKNTSFPLKPTKKAEESKSLADKILLTTSKKKFAAARSTTPSGIEARTKVHRVKSGQILPLNERRPTSFIPSALKKQTSREINRSSKSSAASPALTATPFKPSTKMTQPSSGPNSPTSTASIKMSSWFDGLSASNSQQRGILQPFTRLMKISTNTDNQPLRAESITSGSNSNLQHRHDKPSTGIEKFSTLYPWSLPDNDHFTEAALSYSSTGDWTTRRSSSQLKALTIDDMIKLTTPNSWLNQNVNVSEPIKNHTAVSSGVGLFPSIVSRPSKDSLTTLKMLLVSESTDRPTTQSVAQSPMQTTITPSPQLISTINSKQETLSNNWKNTMKPTEYTTSSTSNNSIIEEGYEKSASDDNTRTTLPFLKDLDSRRIQAVVVSDNKSMISYYPSGSQNLPVSMSINNNTTELEFSPSNPVITITTTTTTTPIPTTMNTEAFTTAAPISSTTSMYPKAASTLLDRSLMDAGTNIRTTIISRPTMITSDNKYSTNIPTEGTTLPHRQFDTMPQTATTGEFFDSETIAQWPERYQTMAAKFTDSMLESKTTTKSLSPTTIQSEQDRFSSRLITTKRTGDQSAPESLLLTSNIATKEPTSTSHHNLYGSAKMDATTTAELYQFLPNNHKSTTTSVQQDSDMERSTTRRQDYETAGAPDDDHSRSYDSYPSLYKISSHQLNSDTPQGYTLVGEVTPSQDGDDSEIEQRVDERTNITKKLSSISSLKPPYLHTQQILPGHQLSHGLLSSEEGAVPYVSMKLYEQLFSLKPTNSRKNTNTNGVFEQKLPPPPPPSELSSIAGSTVREYPLHIDDDNNNNDTTFTKGDTSSDLNGTKLKNKLTSLLYSFASNGQGDTIASEEYSKQNNRNKSIGDWLDWREQERSRAATLYRISSIRHQVPSPVMIYPYYSGYTTELYNNNGGVISDRYDGEQSSKLRNISSLIRQRIVHKDELNARLSGRSLSDKFNRYLGQESSQHEALPDDQYDNQPPNKLKEDFITRLQKLRFIRLLDSGNNAENTDSASMVSSRRSDEAGEADEALAVRNGDSLIDKRSLNISTYDATVMTPHSDISDGINDRHIYDHNNSGNTTYIDSRQNNTSMKSLNEIRRSKESVVVQAQAADHSKEFDCTDKPSGFYPDLDTICKRFFHCSTTGHSLTFDCPHQTRFDRSSMKCSPWYEVTCDLTSLRIQLDSLKSRGT